MQRRPHLTGVPLGFTSCTLDATLCNGYPTLHRSDPTYLTERLTQRSAGLTLPQPFRTASARD